MEEGLFLTIFQKAILLIMLTAAPMLIAAIVIGLTISIIQSVTQIQEQTLTLVPKFFGALLALIVTMPWMVDTFTSTTKELFEYIKAFI